MRGVRKLVVKWSRLIEKDLKTAMLVKSANYVEGVLADSCFRVLQRPCINANANHMYLC